MNEHPDVIAPADPETWIERFVRTATDDVAFVTPAGHVLRWGQYRFTYPRYRKVGAEWRPATYGLDALVLHFGQYEVALPAAQLDLELNDLSDYAHVYHRLTRAWNAAQREQVRAIPINDVILIERVAAVHSKLDFALAGYLSHRTSLQHILSVPGVRIERSRSQLSEVSYALHNEIPSTETIARASNQISLDLKDVMYLESADLPFIEWLRDYPRLRALYDAIKHEYFSGFAVLTEKMFIEAIRRGYSNRDQLLLCRMLLSSAAARTLSVGSVVTYSWMLASLAERLQQYRTAWCIAVRAFSLQARVTSWPDPHLPRENRRFRLVDSESLRTLSDLAHRSNHPYWTTVFTLWKSDLEGMVQTDLAILSPTGQLSEAQEAARAERLWDIARPSWSLRPDEH